MRRKPNEEEENVKEIAIRTEKELNQYFDSFEKTLKDTSRAFYYLMCFEAIYPLNILNV